MRLIRDVSFKRGRNDWSVEGRTREQLANKQKSLGLISNWQSKNCAI